MYLQVGLSFCFAIILCLPSAVFPYIVDPGPVVKATKGGVWPKPQEIIQNAKFLVVKPSALVFQTNLENCTVLNNAFRRYWNIINEQAARYASFEGYSKQIPMFIQRNQKYEADLTQVYVQVGSCVEGEYPDDRMDEAYKLEIHSNPNSPVDRIVASSVWGALRGLETFSQLIHLAPDESTLIINQTTISDFPRFPHRGLLVDTSRHFIPKKILLDNLDAMSYNKLNVFHWHITDDHSFPYQSIKYPELSNKGAYHSAKVYSQKDIKEVIEYARQRGIRVMTEFDTPGHTRSWGEGIKNILTPCYNIFGYPTGQYGPMDPSQNYLYEFLRSFFQEVIDVFPEKYMHLGGDEVEFECWRSNPDLRKFMERLNITGDYVALESFFIQKLLNIIDDLGGKSLVWEEVFVNGVHLPNNTIVHVWKGDGYTVLKEVIRAGKPALLSSCWYLDHLLTGGDWEKYYKCDPHNVNASEEELKLILGGEACMWAESVDETNIMSRMWPRASAAAEKLWSAKGADKYSAAARRLEEHTCRMKSRGITAQPPNGPGFCL